MPLDFELTHVPLLSRGAPDRAAALRHRPDELEAGWATAAVLRVDPSGRFATTPGPGGRRLALDPATEVAERPPADAVFLGRGRGDRHLWSLGVESLPDGPDTGDLRRMGPDLVEGDAALAAEAIALDNWHRSCVRGREPDQWPRRTAAGWSGVDPVHGGTEFPRTDPAVICLVHDGGRRVLLGRGAAWPPGRFSVLAGFVEAGESLEDCVRREIREEVGLDVTRVRYLGSQPWPFPRSLMVGFHAVADPSITPVPEDDEIAETRWVDADEVRRALAGDHPDLRLPPSVSIARVMLESWVAAVEAEAGADPVTSARR